MRVCVRAFACLCVFVCVRGDAAVLPHQKGPTRCWGTVQGAPRANPCTCTVTRVRTAVQSACPEPPPVPALAPAPEPAPAPATASEVRAHKGWLPCSSPHPCQRTPFAPPQHSMHALGRAHVRPCCCATRPRLTRCSSLWRRCLWRRSRPARSSSAPCPARGPRSPQTPTPRAGCPPSSLGPPARMPPPRSVALASARRAAALARRPCPSSRSVRARDLAAWDGEKRGGGLAGRIPPRHAYIHAHTHTRMDTHTCTHTHTHTHTRMHAHEHTYTRTRTHARVKGPAGCFLQWQQQQQQLQQQQQQGRVQHSKKAMLDAYVTNRLGAVRVVGYCRMAALKGRV